jgi:hypothetical protein
MFNFPLSHRKSKKYLTPSGYNLIWAPRKKFRVDGTLISFKVPRYNWFQGRTKPDKPFPHYPLNQPKKLFSDQIPNLITKDENKSDYYEVYNHCYGFSGPWFTGEQVLLYIGVDILRIRRFPSSASFFHPRSYEMMVTDYLTRHFSQKDDKYDGIQQNLAPVDWSPLNHLPVNAARFKIVGQSPQSTKNPESHELHIPIDKNIVVCFTFSLNYCSGQPSFIGSKFVNMAPVNKLVDDIISSIRVKLSPRAEAAQKKALEGLDDTSLTKSFPPLKWDNLDDNAREKALEKIRQWYIDYYEFDGVNVNDNL